MIDIHSHLLYGVDDGPRSFESSVAMLEAAAKDGVRSIVATPHFSDDISENIEEKVNELIHQANKYNIELFSGCEYDFSQLNDQNELITLGLTGNFILVDFCLSFLSPVTANFLYEWQNKGYNIILVHPERLFSKEDLPALKDMAEANMYFQLNAGSFSGDYGRKARRFAKTLVKKGLCHFIASDAHSVRSYSGQIPACRKFITKNFGTDLEKVLFDENPRRMLAGESLVSIW